MKVRHVHLSPIERALVMLCLCVAIAGAAGFAAMKAYESHLRATGQQPSHALMKVNTQSLILSPHPLLTPLRNS